MRSSFFFFAAVSSALVSSLPAQTTDASTPDFFETKIRPTLANNCYSCHTASQLGGLRLDSAEAMMKGGSRGPAIVAGDPDKEPSDFSSAPNGPGLEDAHGRQANGE